jgi:hypothetical protein
MERLQKVGSFSSVVLGAVSGKLSCTYCKQSGVARLLVDLHTVIIHTAQCE